MEGINSELNNTIKKECIDKQAREAAKDIVEHRRPITRQRIEHLREQKELRQLESLEDDYIAN